LRLSRAKARFRAPVRYLSMSASSYLSVAEFASLQAVSRSYNQGAIPVAHSQWLIDLALIFKLLRDLRLTTAGRVRLARVSYRSSAPRWAAGYAFPGP
jgi:hypothetical protein